MNVKCHLIGLKMYFTWGIGNMLDFRGDREKSV